MWDIYEERQLHIYRHSFFFCFNLLNLYYDREYKKFQKGTKVVECKYDYCLDDGDYAWLVNGIEAYGYENMILETLKQLNS